MTVINWPLQALKLKRLRSAAYLHQDQVAHELGCKRQQLSNWERGVGPVPVRYAYLIDRVYGNGAWESISREITRDYQNIALKNALKRGEA